MKHYTSRISRTSRICSSCLLAVAITLAAGCAVGPDYRAPDAPQAARFTATSLPDATAGTSQDVDRAQNFVDVAASPVQWWTVFGNPELNALVETALHNNPTVPAAEAALRQARELALAQRGAFAPSVQAGYSASRARVPNVVASPLSSGSSLYTLDTAQVSVGYVADIFGGNRRSVESLEAQSEFQSWQLLAARLSLAANVVNAVLQEAALRTELTSTERLVAIAARQSELLGLQRKLGAVSGAAVYAQEAQWRQAEATVAALSKQLAQQRNLLAALTGTMPSELKLPTLSFSSLRLPDAPIGVPGRVIAQRPDIRAAAAQLHAANAEVGVAVANMLPQITLVGNYSANAETIGQLLRAGGAGWGVGVGLVQPLFQGGTLLHRKRAAEAQVEQSTAQYRSVVLTAFQNVADALEAVCHDADLAVATARQEQAAQSSLRIAQDQLRLGDISTLVLLNAEAAALQATLAHTQAQANRFGDVTALYQALGGNWDDSHELVKFE